MRKTKIIVTIGPASRSPEMLQRLIEAGMDCARLNFSHGTLPEHAEVIGNIRSIAERLGKQVAILQDLGGIKLRLGQLDKPQELRRGDEVLIGPELSSNRQGYLPFPEPDILKNFEPGKLIYIADGTVCLEVLEVKGLELRTRVRNGGAVSSHKGVNLPGLRIDRDVVTEADKTHLRFGVEQGVDWVAVSFVRTGEDARSARRFLDSIGSKAPIMAKLERAEAVDNLDEILAEVNSIMVARGDMGVEIEMERVPIIQKVMVRKANEAGKLSVIATQMLRSMVDSPTPTRAEISDISNAVLEGCDAILLSDETAVGHYAVEAVQVAVRTILEAEKVYPYHHSLPSRDRTQAMASAADQLVRALNAKPIVITSTGRAALEVSRCRPNHDIIVFSHDRAILRRLVLGWGICPVAAIPPEPDVLKLVDMLVNKTLESGMAQPADTVVILHGFLIGVSGTTNTIQVLNLQEYLTRSDHHRAAVAAAPR